MYVVYNSIVCGIIINCLNYENIYCLTVGIPILPSEPVTSDSVVRRHRSDLCCVLNIKENEASLFSLAGGLLARGIIDTTSKNGVCYEHKEGGTLLIHVEEAVNKNPDMLDVVLEVMEKESCLDRIVRRMKDESDTAGML